MLTVYRVTHPAQSSAGARRAEGGVRGTHGHGLGTRGPSWSAMENVATPKVNRGAWGCTTGTAAGARGRRQTRRQSDFVGKTGPGSRAGFGEGAPPGTGVSSPGRGHCGSCRGAAPTLPADLGGVERLPKNQLERQNHPRSPRVAAASTQDPSVFAGAAAPHHLEGSPHLGGSPRPSPGSERPQLPRGLPWKPRQGSGAGAAARRSLLRALRAEFPEGHGPRWNFCSSRLFLTEAERNRN